MNHEKEYLKLTTVLFKTIQNVESVIKCDIQSHQLNTSEFSALELLFNRGPQPMQTIASRMLMANSSMTYVMDKLEQKGLIRRSQQQLDKRVMMVELTEVGTSFFSNIFPKHVQTLSKMYEHLSEEELVQLIETLKKVGYRAKEILGE